MSPAPIRRSRVEKFSFLRGKSFQITDSSTATIRADELLQVQTRDSSGPAASLAHQFLERNRPILNHLDVEGKVTYDGRIVNLELTASTKVGAVPLISPTTGRTNYGLVIKPRFEWAGIGPMMSSMGWRITPKLIKLPLLPRSERSIPAWVLASMLLARIEALLKQLNRRFTFLEQDLPAPKGNVDWELYVTSRISHTKFLNVPCTFPDLRDNTELLSVIHFALRKILSSLETQRTGGIAVLTLIDYCTGLIERVRTFEPHAPRTSFSNVFGIFASEIVKEGLEAIDWTIEDRGLAGLSDMQGLPWMMSMETFFEGWVETIVSGVSRKVGGVLRTGRKKNTVTPISWDPPYAGSQKSFIPDLILERGDETCIIDAKYKQHWEEFQLHSWRNIEDEIRERHRNDLFQVLAYSSLVNTPKIRSILAYPCNLNTWQSLKDRGRLSHRASIYAGSRSVELILTALPMAGNREEVVDEFAKIIG